MPKTVPSGQFWSENFDDFSSSTSLHGIQYLSKNKKSACERLWWLIMIVTSITFCAIFITKVWNKWNETPVIVAFSETSVPIRQIPFPAITICSTNKFQMDNFNMVEKIRMVNDRGWENLTEREKFEIGSAQEICDLAIEGMPPKKNSINESTIDYLKNVSALVELLGCTWKRKQFDCDDEFTTITTNKGFCRTFNIIDSTELFRENAVQFTEYPVKNRKLTNGWVIEAGYPNSVNITDAYPRICSSPNINAGLRVDLYSTKKNIDHHCGDINIGYKVSVHAPVDLPNLSHEYFIAPPLQQLMIIVKPSMITTSPELIYYSPERRKCYLSNERMLKYFKIYTAKNCEWECLSNYTFRLCDCVGYWMPRESSMPICSTAKSICINLAKSAIEQFGTQYELTNTIGDDELDEKSKDILNQCNCMPSCTSIFYETEITQNAINIHERIRALDINDSSMSEAFITRLKISFKESQFIPSRRSELYGVSDFMANCGGILGLFMGFSILSVVEIIYFWIIRPILSMRKKKN